MKLVKSIEKQIAEWLKDLPHLPEKGQKWIAENIWWLSTLYVVLATVAIVIIVCGLAISALLGAKVGTMVLVYGNSTFFVILSILTFLLLIATVVIVGVAIQPLKRLQKAGWDLLLLVFLINIVGSLISLIIDWGIRPLLSTIIFTLIEVYILFEIRSFFVGSEPIKFTPKRKTVAAKNKS